MTKDLRNLPMWLFPRFFRTHFDWIDDMAFGKQVPDKQVLKSVQQKLVQKAGYGSKVAATIGSDHKINGRNSKSIYESRFLVP